MIKIIDDKLAEAQARAIHEHCIKGVMGKGPAMKRWHFDKCRSKCESRS